MTAAERIAELRAEILRHDRLYYVEARPVISDRDYDALWDELVALERAHPGLVTPDSPTQRVGGAPIEGFAKVRHDPPMRSLDKTYDKGELAQFDAFLRQQLPGETWDYVVEPKIDGVSLSLLYRHGRLVRAATRGTGEVGDDVTANVRTIRSIPLAIPCDAPAVEVRGEVYMPRAGFAALNRAEEEAGREPFANPRNAAAGSLKLLDPREVARRPLDAVLYAAGALDGIAFATHTEMMRAFARWGLRTPPWQRLCLDIQQAMAAIDELETLRHAFPFEIDGAVLKVNQRALYGRLGSTAHAPRSARAYKYAPECARTRLRAITVQVGRTGVLTPVADLDPVPLAGSVIARATLHNADYVREKDIRVGDMVEISKHGDVIPAVDRVVPEFRPAGAAPFALPARCPVCGGETERLEGEVATRCVNPECPAQRVGHLELFVSRGALDIAAIGERMAEALVQAGLVTHPLDLWGLDPKALADFRLAGDDGTERRFGKKAQEVAEALERAKTLPLHRWLYALGLPGIGLTAARVVAAPFASFSALLGDPLFRDVLDFYAATERKTDDRDLLAGEIATRAEALAARGLVLRDDPEKSFRKRFLLTVKPEMARTMARFQASDYARRLAARLAALGIDPKPVEAEAPKGSALAGKQFVITGTLSQPREIFECLIRDNGGAVQSGVSKKTDYLLIGADPGGSKYTKAQALGTPLLDEAAFMALLGAGAEQGEPAKPGPSAAQPAPAEQKPPAAPAQALIQDDLFGELP